MAIVTIFARRARAARFQTTNIGRLGRAPLNARKYAIGAVMPEASDQINEPPPESAPIVAASITLRAEKSMRGFPADRDLLLAVKTALG